MMQSDYSEVVGSEMDEPVDGRSEKKIHWHIDYILEPVQVDLQDALIIGNANVYENDIVQLLLAEDEVIIPFNGIGSSDSNHPSHFFKIPESINWWKLLAEKIMILV